MGDWFIDQSKRVPIVRCRLLERCSGVTHGFSTREQDLSSKAISCPSSDPGLGDFMEAVGLARQLPALLDQVHGAVILRASRISKGPQAADGVVAVRGESGAPAVRTADCLPILLADVEGRAVAAVHAGWRGTAAGIGGSAVRKLTELGIPASSLRAALGPAIGPCCYEVGPEVVGRVSEGAGVDPDAVSRAVAGGRPHLDLVGANRLQLEAAGVPAAAIYSSPWCTVCDSGLFFSYRKEGRSAGRMMAVVGWGGDRQPTGPGAAP